MSHSDKATSIADRCLVMRLILHHSFRCITTVYFVIRHQTSTLITVREKGRLYPAVTISYILKIFFLFVIENITEILGTIWPHLLQLCRRSITTVII